MMLVYRDRPVIVERGMSAETFKATVDASRKLLRDASRFSHALVCPEPSSTPSTKLFVDPRLYFSAAAFKDSLY